MNPDSDPTPPLAPEFRCLGSGTLTPFERIQYEWNGTFHELDADPDEGREDEPDTEP